MSRGQVYYRYRVGRAATIGGVFLFALLGAMVYFLTRGETIALLPLGIVFSGLSISILRHTASVELRLDGEKLVYDYRSFLRHRHRILDPDDVEDISRDIISMWRGSITERLVMKAAGEELELVPIYSDSDPDVRGIYDAVEAARERKRARGHRESREAEARKMREREPEEPRWAVVEMSVVCPACGAPIMVAGPSAEAVCAACGEVVPIDPAGWTDLLEDVGAELRAMEPGKATKSHIMSFVDVDLMYGVMPPYCPECKEDLDIGKVPKSGRFHCPHCGGSISVRRAAGWLNRALEGADMVAGPIDTSGQEGRPSPDRVSFTCPKCGADLRVDGGERIQECEYCGLVFMLPDDLWRRFHPAASAQRWFIRLVPGR